MRPITEIVVATTNRGKLAEIGQALAGLSVTLKCLSDFPRVPPVCEDADTFTENALKKARAVSAHVGLPALADDSGLCVDALGGAPGVRSARFAGEGSTDDENNARLLEMMKEVPDPERTARFVAVLALATPQGEELLAEGESNGLILREPRGEDGFGYDPLFYSPELGATFAEVSRERKLEVSHRGRAIKALVEKLKENGS